VKTKKPHFLFLIETKVFSRALQRLRSALGFEGMIQVDPVGRSSGLAFFWKSNVGVEVMHFSQRHISTTINTIEPPFSWTFTEFYGHPDRSLPNG